MTTDLISRLERGRWDGDNADVLKALGKDPIAFPWYPLDDMNAALRLVPEGWITMVGGQLTTGPYPWAWRLARWPDDRGALGDPCGYGPTAAIALTIAILRAKESDHAR